MIGWLQKDAPSGDVAIASRVRLARNLADTAFPAMMDQTQRETVKNRVWEAIGGDNNATFSRVEADKLKPIERLALLEQHLVSPEWVEQHTGGALIANTHRESIMVCEEDHVRIQAMLPGCQLFETARNAQGLDDILSKQLPYAYDSTLGCLTSCPSNVGTGMRASLMLHLPALHMTGNMDSIIATVPKAGLTVRGIYGEGSESQGCIYQLSNQVTLGYTEGQIIENLNVMARRIIQSERTMRNKLIEKRADAFYDKLWRSYGVLSNARLLSSREFAELLSDVMLLCDTGNLPDAHIHELYGMMIQARPALLQQRLGREIGPEQRDAARAEFVRSELKRITAQNAGNG